MSGRAARRVSGARCAVPRGRVTVNVVPRPSALSTPIVPPCRRTRSRTSASPIPVPSCVRERAPRTRWNRSNTRGSSSSGIPAPVSRTARTTCRGRARSETSISPAKVNFSALERRLRVIFSHMSRSTWTSSGQGSGLTTRRSPARSMAERKVLARSAVSAARSVGSNEAWRRPASAREKSSRVLTSLRSRIPLRWSVERRARCPGGSGSRTSARLSSAGPRIRVSGVRSSWLTLARKSVLARSMASAASLARRSSSVASLCSVMSSEMPRR